MKVICFEMTDPDKSATAIRALSSRSRRRWAGRAAEGGADPQQIRDLPQGSAMTAGLPEAFADHALLRCPNVIVTPHNAYNTGEALQRIITTTVENIAAGRTTNRVGVSFS